jgi:transcriptional regulator with XRE-family HTH domain
MSSSFSSSTPSASLRQAYGTFSSTPEAEALTWLGLYTHDEQLKQFLAWPLFQRLQWLRQQHELSLELLAEVTALPLSLLLELEGGVQRLLATTHRLRLARALKVEPYWLVSHTLAEPASKDWLLGDDPCISVDERTLEMHACGKRLALRPILAHPQGFWPCPACGKGLLVRTFERRDPDDMPITALTLTCTQCTFSHTHEVLEL